MKLPGNTKRRRCLTTLLSWIGIGIIGISLLAMLSLAGQVPWILFFIGSALEIWAIVRIMNDERH